MRQDEPSFPASTDRGIASTDRGIASTDRGVADIEFYAFRAVCDLVFGDHTTDEEHHARFLKARTACTPLYSYWKQTAFNQGTVFERGVSFADKLHALLSMGNLYRMHEQAKCLGQIIGHMYLTSTSQATIKDIYGVLAVPILTPDMLLKIRGRLRIIVHDLDI